MIGILQGLGYKRHSRFLLASALGSLPGEGRRQALRTLSLEDGEEGNPPAARQQELPPAAACTRLRRRFSPRRTLRHCSSGRLDCKLAEDPRGRMLAKAPGLLTPGLWLNKQAPPDATRPGDNAFCATGKRHTRPHAGARTASLAQRALLCSHCGHCPLKTKARPWSGERRGEFCLVASLERHGNMKCEQEGSGEI